MREEPLNIFEIGVYTGSSIAVWEEYFPNAIIVGLDVNQLKREFGQRVHFIKGSQTDADLLKSISNQYAPGGWDIIIDDASHVASKSRITYDVLFKDHLRKGGLYFIEDWGTGYWDDWPDGKVYSGLDEKKSIFSSKDQHKSHDYGMVGLVKQLIDEAGMDSIKKLSSDAPARGTMFEYMEVNFAFAMVKKL